MPWLGTNMSAHLALNGSQYRRDITTWRREWNWEVCIIIGKLHGSDRSLIYFLRQSRLVGGEVNVVPNKGSSASMLLGRSGISPACTLASLVTRHEMSTNNTSFFLIWQCI
jgi:hypothetical protein